LQGYSLEVHHAKIFISQWIREGIEEGMFDVDIIHVIDRIKLF